MPLWGGDACLSYRVGRGGAWASVGADRDDLPRADLNDSASSAALSLAVHQRAAPRFSYGLWRQLGSAVLTVSVDAHSLWRLGTVTSSRQFVRVDSVMDTLTRHMIAVPHQVTHVDTSASAMLARASDAEARLAWSRSRLAL